MNVTGLLESGIYVDDVPRSAEFYRRVFGFEQLVGDDRFCALSVAGPLRSKAASPGRAGGGAFIFAIPTAISAS